MAPKKPPENAWVQSELERAAKIAHDIGADDNTRQRVASMWDHTARNSIIATAAAYRIGDPPTGRLIRPNNSEGWESECWQMYDSVGELHYVAGQNGRSVAQARLFIAEYGDDGIPREVDSGDAAAMSRDLLGGENNSADLKFALGVQGMIAGQSLITVSDNDGWQVYSDQDIKIDAQELKRASRSKGVSPYRVDRGGQRPERLPEGTLTIHLWDRHPGRAFAVDSSTRPAIPYLRELCRLDEYVQSTLLSRIATAGILQVPQGASPAPPSGQPPLPENTDPLMHALATVGAANISNPGTASALLPILMTMPPGERLEHLTLDFPLTNVINEFRDMNLRRVAMSMDMAPETMSGFTNVKYSNAEFIQGESIRTHVVRRVAAIAGALVKGYVVPALGERFTVRWDLSELEIPQDRTESAIALYDRGELTGDSLRDIVGLSEAEFPEGEDLLKHLAMRAIVANPSLLPALAPVLGFRDTIKVESEVPSQVESGDTEDDESTDDADTAEDTAPTAPGPPPPAGPGGPAPVTTKGTQPPASVSATLVAACDVVVAGALGRAGATWRKRRRSRIAATRHTDTQAIYLEHPICADREATETPRDHASAIVGGRFGAVPRIAAIHGANPECLQASLVNYVAELIVDRRPHHPDQLAGVLAECAS